MSNNYKTSVILKLTRCQNPIYTHHATTQASKYLHFLDHHGRQSTVVKILRIEWNFTSAIGSMNREKLFTHCMDDECLV